jgi:pilus assembly protein Flp/PilA
MSITARWENPMQWIQLLLRSSGLRVLRDRSGATAIEYGLIAALIAVAAVATMSTVGTNLTNVFGSVGSSL